MLGDPRQVGTEFKISFGNLSYTGYLPEDGVSFTDNMATEEKHTDERGATITRIFYDDGQKLDVSFKIKETGGTITPPKKGAIISITTPTGSAAENFIVADADVTLNRGVSMLKLSLEREDNMQGTYDADTTPPAPTLVLTDNAAGVVGISVSLAWPTGAAHADYVDIYLASTDSQPSEPYMTVASAPCEGAGSQNIIGLRTYAPAITVYGWAVARNSLSSTATTDNVTLA